MSESALDSLDREVERLKQNFNSNREMFENVSRWQSLFVKFLDFEVQSRPHLSQKFKQSHPNICTHVGDPLPLSVRPSLYGCCFYQKKTSDPGRLFNRGGALLKEQKERKKYESQLPRVSRSLFLYLHFFLQTQSHLLSG